MRYLTSGLLLALLFGLVPPAAADGGSSSGTVPGFGVLNDWITFILDWLGFREDPGRRPPSADFGPGVEPNGLGVARPASAEIGAGLDSNGLTDLRASRADFGPGVKPGG